MDTTFTHNKSRALCPHCHTVSHQRWYRNVSGRDVHGYGLSLDSIELTACDFCNQNTIWYKKNMIWPDALRVAEPNPDLPEEIITDYLEAASVLGKSPKAAAALIRLCLQKLCKHLGQKGKNINEDIASLVVAGLPIRIQKAMDSIRIIGNNAVHPGEINPADDPQMVPMLFALINMIADSMITQQKEIDRFYALLPERDRVNIDKRDSKI